MPRKGEFKKNATARSKQQRKYNGSPAQKKNRAKRNAARRKMEKAGKVKKGDGKDVDHKNGVKAGNGSKNLRVKSKSSNRSFPRNKKAGKR